MFVQYMIQELINNKKKSYKFCISNWKVLVRQRTYKVIKPANLDTF